MKRRQDSVQIPSPLPGQVSGPVPDPRSVLPVLRSPAGMLALILLLVITGVILADEILRPGRFTIERVTISNPLKRVDGPIIERTVWQNLEGNYFTVDLPKIETRLARLPGVYRAAVRRVWPDSLAVSITESDVIARWHSFADQAVVKSEFVNLPPGTGLSLQPLLTSAIADRRKVIKTYLELTRILGPVGLEPSAVSMNSSGGFRLVVASKTNQASRGVEIVIGREEPLKKVGRFAAAFDLVLRDRWSDMERVDLRYASGFAVQWKGIADSSMQLADSRPYGN
ncbi:MAG: FtsQ-type POTRA domain-containing protein [Pseudomonadota bacterium]|nr:FtsQ-type POTRA domain-containing protein [Pseudomonadota bacterium]